MIRRISLCIATNLYLGNLWISDGVGAQVEFPHNLRCDHLLVKIHELTCLLCLVYDENEQAAENGCAESKKKCAEWVNFSSFLARCIAAGVYPEGLDRFRYPISDIVEGLEKDVSGATGIKRTYRVMAAAQYILLAPKVIYEELGEIKEWELGMGKWNLWAHRFKEIANKYDFGSETNAVVKEARDKMISFDPSQFFVSEGGNKPDP